MMPISTFRRLVAPKKILGLLATILFTVGFWSLSAFAATGDWSALKTADQGGPNVAYVDKESLDSTELAQLRQLTTGEVIQANWRYKLVYAKDETKDSSSSSSSSNPPSTTSTPPSTKDEQVKRTPEGQLPQTGEDTMVMISTLGLVFLGGAFVLVFRRKGRGVKGLVVLLLATGTLSLGTSAVKAYSGTALKGTTLLATGTVITPPTIDGYHYVGVISTASGSVIARYVDTDGQEIADSVTVADGLEVGTTYATEQKVIDGYQFKELATDSAAASGTVTDSTQTVTYVYDKLGTYTLNLSLRLNGWFTVINTGKTDYDGKTIDVFGKIVNADKPVSIAWKGQEITPTKGVDEKGASYLQYDLPIYTSQGVVGEAISGYPTTDEIKENLTITYAGTTYHPDEFVKAYTAVSQRTILEDLTNIPFYSDTESNSNTWSMSYPTAPGNYAATPTTQSVTFVSESFPWSAL
ncbi:MucBP domain-containing protein [Streptococcus sp. DD13]|uniref:MucBP domain-containing protein n=1 Tax=Streptococcus sp. DD13 TaxID=1777881 RepID=UPI000795B746|nr:MucBP domain-containing protein [Streptococcus sp. DD13]KXT78045.1 hypothetical protein STRDD13_01046 [Streptococcus sp. DD13]